MDNFEELAKTGREIMSMVDDAIARNDYSNLNKDISRQVLNLTEEINKYNQAQRKRVEQTNRRKSQNRPPNRPNVQNTRPNTANSRKYSTAATARNTGTFFQQVNPSYSNSIFKLVFGVCGLAIFIPETIAGLMMLIWSAGAGIATTAIFGGLSFASYKLLRRGMKDRKLIDSFYKYSRVIGNEEYITIERLAVGAGESERTVLANLRSMQESGLLPHGRITADNSTLMLSNKVYQQYINAAKAAEETNRKEAARRDEIDQLNVSENVKKILRNGEDIIDKLQKYNDQIPDEVMTAKLDQLKNIVDRIFKQVRKDPKHAGDLSRLMNYYLPTTEKLLKAYIDLDKQPDSSKNVAKTKKEIEGAIDTINSAFENLFDDMFEEVAWDISTDISAMKTMMAQDGLTQDSEGNVISTH